MPDVPLVVSPSPTTRSQRAREGRDRIAADLARLIEGEVRFGRCGEGFVRISAFNTRQNVEEVVRRLAGMKM